MGFNLILSAIAQRTMGGGWGQGVKRSILTCKSDTHLIDVPLHQLDSSFKEKEEG